MNFGSDIHGLMSLFLQRPHQIKVFIYSVKYLKLLSDELAQNLGLQTSMIPKSDLTATSFLWRHNEVNIRF